MSLYEKITEKWKSLNIDSVSKLDQHLENFRILFAYNSGKIENENIEYHDTREIFENGKVLNYTGDPRAIFELQNQKMCYEFLKGKIIRKEPLTVELVKEIHEILTAGSYDERRFIERGERPGRFKIHDYVTGIREVGYPPNEVESAVRELLCEIENYSGDWLIRAAAYFHLKFEHIHPFADGNGRAGRTLLNYFLMTRAHPPLIIYDEDKARYFKALEKYDANEDIDEMCEFLTHETEKTWRKTLGDEARTQKIPMPNDDMGI